RCRTSPRWRSRSSSLTSFSAPRRHRSRRSSWRLQQAPSSTAGPCSRTPCSVSGLPFRSSASCSPCAAHPACLAPTCSGVVPPPAPWSGDRFARPCPLAPPPRRARPCFHALLFRERARPPVLQRTRAGRLHAAFDRRLLARDRPLAPPVVALPPRRGRFTRSQEGSRAPARLVGVGAGVLHHERVAA